MTAHPSRRAVLAGAGAAAAIAIAPAAAAPAGEDPFGYCLNMSTIRGMRGDIAQQAEIAAAAGYGAIEPWLGPLRQYQQSGKPLKDLAKKIAGLGLKVPGAIGFSRWIVDDEAQRTKGLEQLKSDMDIVRQIGGTGIAASPGGAKRPLDLSAAAERYRAVLELGDEMGVAPRLELWGPSPLHRIGQAAYVAIESGHPKANLLLDAYHIYKGGSDFTGLKMLGPLAMQCFHMNDYPADPPRETIRDQHRVYPGDGVAPFKLIVRTLRDIGFRGWLSLELFNPNYWKRPAAEVAKTGLAKMKAVVRNALA